MPRTLQCEICGVVFPCGMGGAGCWCTDLSLSEAALAKLKTQAKDCVCPSCLSKFACDR
ncbi:MAG: cysteine-rich CWC family protein [Candidatus Bathyarchaeia archaeon]